MGANFSIIDHCFEHPKYDPTSSDIDRFFADRCSYNGCGRPEIEHCWTVEAYRDNEDALQGESDAL